MAERKRASWKTALALQWFNWLSMFKGSFVQVFLHFMASQCSRGWVIGTWWEIHRLAQFQVKPHNDFASPISIERWKLIARPARNADDDKLQKNAVKQVYTVRIIEQMAVLRCNISMISKIVIVLGVWLRCRNKKVVCLWQTKPYYYSTLKFENRPTRKIFEVDSTCRSHSSRSMKCGTEHSRAGGRSFFLNEGGRLSRISLDSY